LIGSFEDPEGEDITLRQPQILRVLKTIELIGFFNEFKTSTCQEIDQHKLSPEEAEVYKTSYQSWFELYRQVSKKLSA